MMRSATMGMLVLVLLLSAPGCSALKKPYPDQKSYLLEVVHPDTQPLAGRQLVLKIDSASVAASYQGVEFVYRQKDGSLVADFYNNFFQPPGVLLTEQLRQWFSGPTMDPLVLRATDPDLATHGLHVRMRSLYGDYSGENPEAVMEMEVILSRQEGPRMVPLFRNIYSGRRPLGDDSPGMLVEGWNRVLGDMLSELNQDLLDLDLQPWRAPDGGVQ